MRMVFCPSEHTNSRNWLHHFLTSRSCGLSKTLPFTSVTDMCPPVRQQKGQTDVREGKRTTEGSDGCARGKKDNSRVRRMYERKKKKQSFSVLQGDEDQEGEAVPPRRSTSRGQHSQANGAAWGCSARAAPRGFGISCQQQPSSGTRSQQVQVVPFFSPTVCCRNSRNGA